MPQMDDLTLKGILASHIAGSVGERGSTIVQTRLRAQRYYRGDLFGNEEEGRSKVVSRDVAETIDQMMPPLVRMFMASDQIVRFEPRLAANMGIKEGTPPDAAAQARIVEEIKKREAQAEQATDYCNWVWRSLNDGYRVLYEWFKDALKFKNGVAKFWWDATPTLTRQNYDKLDDAQMEAMRADDDIEIIEHNAYPDPAALGALGISVPSADGITPSLPMLHDITVIKTNKNGGVRLSCVPLDEFLIQHRATRIEGADFSCHRYQETVSKLAERFPEFADEIRTRLASDEGDFSQERIERFRAEDGIGERDGANLDPTMRLVWICESFLRVDYDGDGIAEMRAVISAGDGEGADLILSNEETDDNPFADLSPDIEPHAFWGRSITDQVEDIQLIKSAMLRGVLDTIYNANAPQMGVDTEKVNLDDLLTRRVGGLVRTKGDPRVGLFPIPTLPVAQDAYQGLAMMDAMREQRTGVRRFAVGPGADTIANAYSDTATGANLVHESGQERIELIARNFAETGVKRAFRLILKLEAKHRQEPRLVRLRETWVTVDPREWDTEMGMIPEVGLGTGSRMHQMQGLGFLLNLDKEIIGMQKGLNGPLLYPEHLYNKLEKACQAFGFRSATPYYAEPPAHDPNAPPPPPPPDPETVKAQAQMQLAQQDAAFDAQNNQARVQADIAAMQAKAQVSMQLDQQRHEHAMQMEERKAQHEMQLEQARAQAKYELEMREIALRAQAGAYTTGAAPVVPVPQ